MSQALDRADQDEMPLRMPPRAMHDQIDVEPVGDRSIITDYRPRRELVDRTGRARKIFVIDAVANGVEGAILADQPTEKIRGDDDAIGLLDQGVLQFDHARRDAVEPGQMIEAIEDQRRARNGPRDRIPGRQLQQTYRATEVQGAHHGGHRVRQFGQQRGILEAGIDDRRRPRQDNAISNTPSAGWLTIRNAGPPATRSSKVMLM